MDDKIIRLLFFAGINAINFLLLYFYGRQSWPKRAAWLCGTTFLITTVLCSINGAWGMLTVLLTLIYLFVLRKPNQRAAFQQFYKDNEIFSTSGYSHAALAELGNKSWIYAEGKLKGYYNNLVPYGFWQGRTSQSVSSGQFVRTTTFIHYIAFVFPPGCVSENFKRTVMEAADKSRYSFREKIKYFFVPNMEIPNLVKTAADGSFIIQYITLPDPVFYNRRLVWVRENFSAAVMPAIKISFSVN